MLLIVCSLVGLLLNYRKALMACILGSNLSHLRGTSDDAAVRRSDAAKFAIRRKAKDMRIEDWLHVKVKKVDSKKISKK